LENNLWAFRDVVKNKVPFHLNPGICYSISKGYFKDH
jgi:hypothetical protein